MNTAITANPIAPVVGLWDEEERKLFARYRTTIQFEHRVMGGIPQKPDIIESWLRQRVTGGDEEVRQMMMRHMDELGIDVSSEMTIDELTAAAKKMAAEQNGNTFYRDEEGLFLSNYQFKAMLKENVSILFPYNDPKNRMGATKKAARAYWAERVFVDELRIHLGRMEPDGTHLQIGHVTGPKGPRSTLTYYDYCENQPDNPLTATFTISSLEDCIDEEMWKKTLLACQRNGIGAIRSQGYGTFRVIEFEGVK